MMKSYLWVADPRQVRKPQSAFKVKSRQRRLLVIQNLLLPGVQHNSLHPFGGVNTR
jgi:hypothetical protein